MQFLEAVEKLCQGDKIRRKTWSKNSAWRLVDGKLYNNNGDVIDDWEVVEEEPSFSNRVKKLEKELTYLKTRIEEILKCQR